MDNIFIITLIGGENVNNKKNKFLLIVSVFLFALFICGSASATEN